MRMRLPWLFAALLTSLVLTIVNMVALQNSWYWQYRWIDTPMHLLGGAVIALFLVGLLKNFRPYVFILGIAVTAIGWEIFEYVFHISTNQPHYFLDTSHDVLNDVIGACFVYIIARLSVWRSA